MLLRNRTSIDLIVETIGLSNAILEKKWDKVPRVYNKGVKISEKLQIPTTESQFLILSEI